MIAALQMYAWPEVRPETEKFWQAAAHALQGSDISAPSMLTWADEISTPWRSSDLLVGQTCGLPFVHGRCGNAVIIARPGYGLEGADGGTYQSALVARTDGPSDLTAFRGSRAAVNELTSQSGCNALAGTLFREGLSGPEPFFGSVVFSGAHRRSAAMVADGAADLAAIDAVAWALFARTEPARYARLKIVAWSDPVPALPFITAPAHAELAVSVVRALQDAAASVGKSDDRVATPGIPTAIIAADAADYEPIRALAKALAGLRLSQDAPALPAIA